MLGSRLDLLFIGGYTKTAEGQLTPVRAPLICKSGAIYEMPAPLAYGCADEA